MCVQLTYTKARPNKLYVNTRGRSPLPLPRVSTTPGRKGMGKGWRKGLGKNSTAKAKAAKAAKVARKSRALAAGSGKAQPSRGQAGCKAGKLKAGKLKGCKARAAKADKPKLQTGL